MNLLEQLTDAEEKIRDSTLKPALDLLVPRWVSPNHITMLRAVLVSVAMILYFTDTPLAAQIWVLAAAALTDFVDGPLGGCAGKPLAGELTWTSSPTGSWGPGPEPWSC